MLHLATGIDYWYSREVELLRSCALQALQQARGADRPELVAEAIAQLVAAASEQGTSGDALAWLQEAQRLVDGLSDEQLAQRIEGIAVLGHISTKLDLYDHAVALFDRGLQIARASGQDWWLVLLTVDRAIVKMRLGRLHEAIVDTAIRAGAGRSDPSCERRNGPRVACAAGDQEDGRRVEAMTGWRLITQQPWRSAVASCPSRVLPIPGSPPTATLTSRPAASSLSATVSDANS